MADRNMLYIHEKKHGSRFICENTLAGRWDFGFTPIVLNTPGNIDSGLNPRHTAKPRTAHDPVFAA